MKILQLKNESIMDLVTTEAILKSPVAAGSSVTMTLDDNTGLSNADYVLVGEIGKGKTEIATINAAVTRGTAIQVATLVFPHNAGTPVRKIPYNQVKFYRAATLAGTKSQLGSAVAIDVEKEFTSYEDSANSTGYGFFTFYNSTTTAESGYSAGFNYADLSARSRDKIREFVTSPHNWNKKLDEATFVALCDYAEAEIFSIKRWRFREKTVSFSSVASQQAYTLAEAGATDLGQLMYATYDGDPVFPVSLRVHRRLNWNSTQTGKPRTVCEYGGNLEFTPTPSEVKPVILYYYKNSSGFADETSETAVKLSQAIAFRILQDLWAMVDMNKSQYFERRYLQTISAMKIDDNKQASRFPSLSDFGYDDPEASFDQVMHPNRIT
jgi:hypothetical protein